MSAHLPEWLYQAVQTRLQNVSLPRLRHGYASLSKAYGAQPTFEPGGDAESRAQAYLVARMPATYAACATVLAEAARMAPGFRPASLMDAGAGTGAASWAALAVWPGLAAVRWLDASPLFLDLAAMLATDVPVLAGAEARRADLTQPEDWPRSDLVVASYALAEIAPERQAALVGSLWAAADGLLALVEPGTPAGYERILAARTALIEAGATVLAPCPHQAACPLLAPDWCHFSVRLPRSRDHRLAKGAEVPFEDERFAYLVAARPGVVAAPRAPRILAPPHAAKPGITLKLCGPAGVEQRFVPRRDKASYPAARRLGWGDALPSS